MDEFQLPQSGAPWVGRRDFCLHDGGDTIRISGSSCGCELRFSSVSLLSLVSQALSDFSPRWRHNCLRFSAVKSYHRLPQGVTDGRCQNEQTVPGPPRKCSLRFHLSNIIITHFSDTLPRVKLFFFKHALKLSYFNSQFLRLHSSVVTRWATPVRDPISSVLELCCIKCDSRNSGGNRLCVVSYGDYTQ